MSLNAFTTLLLYSGANKLLDEIRAGPIREANSETIMRSVM